MPNVLTTTAKVGQLITLDTPSLPSSINVLVQAATSGGSVAPLTRTVYVDPGSSAGTENGSIAEPFKTVSSAVAGLAATGGTILLVPNDYSGEAAITLDCTYQWHLIALDQSTADAFDSTVPQTQLPSVTLLASATANASLVSFQSVRFASLACPVEIALLLESCRVASVSAAPTTGERARLIGRNSVIGEAIDLATIDLISCTLSTGATYSVTTGGQIRAQDTRGGPASISAFAGTILADNASLPAFGSTTGTLTILGQPTAPDIAYTPTTPGNWLPVPTQVRNALDQLATPKATSLASGALAAANPISYTTPAQTPQASGTYLVIASGSGTSVSAAIETHTLSIDGGAALVTAQTETGANRPYAFCMAYVAALSNSLTHAFTVQSQASTGNLSAPAGGYRITLLELGA